MKKIIMKLFKIRSEKEVEDRILFLSNEARLRETEFIKSAMTYITDPNSDFIKVCNNEIEFRKKYSDKVWPK